MKNCEPLVFVEQHFPLCGYIQAHEMIFRFLPPLSGSSIWSRVGHGERVWLGEFEVEVLIVELGTTDALPTCSIKVSEVASLGHEARNESVEGTALIAQWFAHLAYTVVTLA